MSEFGEQSELRGLGEFDLIKKYFSPPMVKADLGGGDDCALFRANAGHQLAMSSDMLVAGRHFFVDVNPHALGHKSLAVNLSDLAACGAKPLVFTLALALPKIDSVWLQEFSQGLLQLAKLYGCELIGGDTTCGPLTISLTVIGELPQGSALLRSGAKLGDDIFVSGCLGDARLALLDKWAQPELKLGLSKNEEIFCQERLEKPTPRVRLGLALRSLASSCIDLSDGLWSDLSHVLQASQVGAVLDTDVLMGCMHTAASITLPNEKRLEHILLGGDDYELLWTAHPQMREKILLLSRECGVPVTRIGAIAEKVNKIDLIGKYAAGIDGSKMTGYDHFRG